MMHRTITSAAMALALAAPAAQVALAQAPQPRGVLERAPLPLTGVPADLAEAVQYAHDRRGQAARSGALNQALRSSSIFGLIGQPKMPSLPLPEIKLPSLRFVPPTRL